MRVTFRSPLVYFAMICGRFGNEICCYNFNIRKLLRLLSANIYLKIFKKNLQIMFDHHYEPFVGMLPYNVCNNPFMTNGIFKFILVFNLLNIIFTRRVSNMADIANCFE